jgi:hypothetical protein
MIDAVLDTKTKICAKRMVSKDDAVGRVYTNCQASKFQLMHSRLNARLVLSICTKTLLITSVLV